jgi:hypothetical protein
LDLDSCAQNVCYVYDRVRAHITPVVLVDTYKFAVVAKSKKTDRHDAITLARVLELGWLLSLCDRQEAPRR